MQQPLRPVDDSPGSVLAHLRGVIPTRPLGYQDALRAAERCASRFIELYGITTLPVPSALVTDLPRIGIDVDFAMPTLTSGSSVWDGALSRWVISLNGREPATRQRFTMMHEFFHIVVHRDVERSRLFARLRADQIEFVADYFAGCVLVPKRLLRQAWASGIQNSGALAEIFDVSPRAIEVRLAQIRLIGTGSEYQEVAQTRMEAAS